MGIFTKLHELRTRHKKALSFLRTPLDLDIILELGRAQESRRIMGAQALSAANIGPRATISRRLTRLKHFGVVLERRVLEDRRRRALVLHSSVSARLEKLLQTCRRIRTA